MIQKSIIVNNLQIRYHTSNVLQKDGVLVYLHGWKSEATHFKNILENCNNFVAVDLPGFGGSEKPKEIWGVSEYAKFLDEFLKKLQIENPVLAGHSFGGSIIIKYAANGNPAEKIILIDSAGIRKKGFKIFVYKIIAKIFKLILSIPGISLFKNSIRKKFYKAIDSEDYIEAGEMIEIYRKVIQEDLSNDLKNITQKTIIIWGENDTATSLWQGEKMQELIPNAELFIIKNAGHYVFLDQTEEFKKVFLSKCHSGLDPESR